MVRWILGILILLCAILAPVSAPAQKGSGAPHNNSLYRGLVGYWALDETSGNRQPTFAAGSVTMTDNNTVGFDAGKIGNSALFVRANSEDFSIADNDLISTGGGSNTQFAITAWMDFSQDLTGSVFMQLCGKNGAGSDFEFDVIAVEIAGTDQICIELNATGGYQIACQNIPSFATGTFYFVYAYADGSNIGISINNQAATTQAYTGNLRNGTTAFRVGSSNGSTHFHDGHIDVFAYWKSRVLAQSERDYLYRSGNGRSPLGADIWSWLILLWIAPEIYRRFSRRRWGSPSCDSAILRAQR